MLAAEVDREPERRRDEEGDRDDRRAGEEAGGDTTRTPTAATTIAGGSERRAQPPRSYYGTSAAASAGLCRGEQPEPGAERHRERGSSTSKVPAPRRRGPRCRGRFTGHRTETVSGRTGLPAKPSPEPESEVTHDRETFR